MEPQGSEAEITEKMVIGSLKNIILCDWELLSKIVSGVCVPINNLKIGTDLS
jgi:hypothetical protein